MRRFLLAQFSPVLQAWRNGYEGEVRRSVIAFFVLILLAFGVCLAVPEVRLGLSAYLQGFYPVSYTHLDVYKRQNQSTSPFLDLLMLKLPGTAVPRR